VGAIYGEDLEILSVDAANPTRDIRRFAIPRIINWISIGSEARLANWKSFQSSERKP
jgi:hypothetical protein